MSCQWTALLRRVGIVPLLFWGVAGQAGCAQPRASSAYISTAAVKLPPDYNRFQPPKAGESYIDPVFGSSVFRISDAAHTANAADNGNLPFIENEYSTVNAFNNDGSYFILLHQSYFALYRGTGSFVRNLPLELNSSSEPRWSRRDASTLYYHRRNQLRTYNVATGKSALVHIFREYSSISGLGKSDIPPDGNHIVLLGDKRYVFVYDIAGGRKSSVLDAGPDLLNLYITSHDNVVVTWRHTGAGKGTGIELFDSGLKYQRQLAHADGHLDFTVDDDGSEVMVWSNAADPQPIPNCENGVVKVRLADGTQTCLLALDWSLSVHISTPDGNGWAYVDTEAPQDPAPGSAGWVAYTNELLQVRLDGSQVIRLAHHRSRPVDDYNWQPKVSVSRDGARLLFASNFGLRPAGDLSPHYVDEYFLVLTNNRRRQAGSMPGK